MTAALYSARWRRKHPDRARESARRSQKRRTITERWMRDRYPDEYAAICAQLADDGVTDMRRYRAAVCVLRDRYPAAWQEGLDYAREVEP